MTGSGEELSVREISRRTGVPESTLRYYRDVFPEHIPTSGRGRKRRHPEAAIPVFQRISRLFEEGASRHAVRRALRSDSPQGAPRPASVDDGGTAPKWDERPHALTRREPGAMAGPELEDLLAAMLTRDRELVSMHRELLQVLEGLIRALAFMASGEARYGEPPPSRFSPPPASADESVPAADAEEEEYYETADVTDELQRLKESLASERETVERLRRARLELEQRLRQIERRGAGGAGD